MPIYDDFRLIGVPFKPQLVRETRLLHNRTFLVSNQRRLFVLLTTEFILAFNCLIGDYYIFRTNALIDLVGKYTGLSERLVRALMDNTSHFIVAFLSWLLITYSNESHMLSSILKEMFYVGLMASLIDLDHFIAAKSMSLGQALHLSKRPFLHNSLTMLILNAIVYVATLLACNDPNTSKRISLMFFVAWWTHHIRDANRRGLWLGPLFTTRPIKRDFYLGIILILPLLLRHNLADWLRACFKSIIRHAPATTIHLV